MHDDHEGFPGFDPRQIWKDGCAECRQRARTLPMSMLELDPEHFRAAWQRAYAWEHDDDTSLRLSQTELPLLRQLWAIQIMLERYFGWPIGRFPDFPLQGLAHDLNAELIESGAFVAVPAPGGLEDVTGLLGTHPNLDERCRFKGCQFEAEETTAVVGAWLRYMEPPCPRCGGPLVANGNATGPADALYCARCRMTAPGLLGTLNVPLCHEHAEVIRRALAEGCDLDRCRWPFGRHATTCAAYIPYRTETEP